MDRYSMDVYRAVKRVLGPLPWVSEADMEQAVRDIVLTWAKVRPGCIPFEPDMFKGGGRKIELSVEMMAELVAAAPGLMIKFGPYYDTGERYYVCTDYYWEKDMSVLAGRVEEMRARGGKGTAEFHSLMASLLGYVGNGDDFRRSSKEAHWDLVYAIEGGGKVTRHMGCWVAREADEWSGDAAALLDRMVKLGKECGWVVFQQVSWQAADGYKISAEEIRERQLRRLREKE